MDEDAAPSGGTGAIWLALVAAVASARRRRRAGVQASAT
jgi:MYXO-CTERM domain-containing protein